MGKLHSLEVVNFKSYGGRHLIGPFTDFTCLIGPNGAGKSNLMDAISFVLGVKSTHLRSSQLKELIHRNVSHVEQSLAAHVIAKYRKADGSVVDFKRSITPSGTCEYFINNQLVTFAQYKNTLELENILVKARNFLVFQGDVESIASQNPRDLTRLLEQISGSDEFKQEYESFEAELSKTAENSALNFNKKRGLAAEIKQFKEQKEEALRYEKLQHEKHNLITTRFLWRLFHIGNDMNQLEIVLERKREAAASHRNNQINAKSELKEEEKGFASLQLQKMAIEKKLECKIKESNLMRPKICKLDEQIEHHKKKLKIHMDSLEKSESDLRKQENEHVDIEKQLFELKNASKIFEDHAVNELKKSSAQLTPDQLKIYKELRDNFQTKTLKDSQQIKTLKRKLQAESEIVARLNDEVLLFKGKQKKLFSDSVAYGERKNNLTVALDEKNAELKILQDSLSKVIDDKRRIIQSEREAEEKLAELYKTLNRAKFDKKESERIDRLRIAVEAMKRMFTGVHGRAVDLCKPVQKKFETAISIVLGKNMEAIIVDNDKIAIDCIKYLRDQQIGQATFIPLENIQVKPTDEKYRSIIKGCRMAIDVIQFSPKFERAFLFACGNTLICDDLATARAICYEKHQKIKAVTLDGTVIHKAGMITGGRADDILSGSQKWEEKELGKLRQLKDQFESQLEELGKNKRSLLSQEKLSAEITTIESCITGHIQDLATVSRKLQSITEETAHISQQYQSERKNYSNALEVIASLQKEILKLEESLHLKEDEFFKAFCQKAGIRNIRDYELDSLKVSHEISEKRMLFAKQLARLETEILFSDDNLKGTRVKLNRLQTQIDADHVELQRLDKERKKIVSQYEAIKDEIGGLQEKINDVADDLKRNNTLIIELRRKHQENLREAESLSKELIGMESLMEKLHAERFELFRRCKLENIMLPMKKGSIDDLPLNAQENLQSSSSLDSSASKIIIDFDELDDELKQNSDEIVENMFTERIKSIASEIDQMTPNMKAIEKLQEIENRLNVTAKEFEESRRQAKSSREMFLIIKRKRTERFMDAFNHVVENIDRVYKELTKSKTHPVGGTAYLTLENTEEPFNGGIKYHAMPPMKRFRDMELLSGGEKTMAALALLFAIHSYQPSPFFVMDEVDAALDNANVSKLAQFIRTYSTDNLQFIVISLKSTLYEKSQALVGIYKDWNAITSRVLTLDLTKYAE